MKEKLCSRNQSSNQGDPPMKTTNISEENNFTRRRFLSVAAMSVAATKFMLGSVSAQTTQADAANGNMNKPGTNTSFGPLKQINAGVLNVSYAEAGPSDGPVVILFHGWPYDIHSYVDVAPI